jgi:uncharacterized membrane protein YhaH (DUF805 family)
LDFSPPIGVLSSLYTLATIIPSLAVQVRRLHDIGWSGWLVLLNFVPFANIVILLILLFKEGQPGANQYGPNPKEVPSA